MATQEQLNALALDLDACDLGIALTKGKLKARYIAHRKACLDELARLNKEDGIDGDMTDDELLAALGV